MSPRNTQSFGGWRTVAEACVCHVCECVEVGGACALACMNSLREGGERGAACLRWLTVRAGVQGYLYVFVKNLRGFSWLSVCVYIYICVFVFVWRHMCISVCIMHVCLSVCLSFLFL